MQPEFYLPRTIESEGLTYSEAELLAASRHIVVLAEPGGGKTRLLESLASQLETSVITANVFSHIEAQRPGAPLVIDAFDELAKVGQQAISKLLSMVRLADPSVVVISSRSSEWDSSATNSFKEFLGHLPRIVRLRELDTLEIRQIFEHYIAGEDFEVFEAEVARFELESLLPNPQFLKLFADAYVESGRRFAGKRSIFAQAVERLAKEANPSVTPPASYRALAPSEKIQLVSEVFTKVLLSGSEGVTTSEVTATPIYPLLSALVRGGASPVGILATRLFKPGDSEDTHRPVHKIVSEYCAAGYLTKKIIDPVDPLTISKCLAVLAPNSTVRDELRGLLGWMACVGTKKIQEAAIRLDPYAVLANGDPSQLDPSSKQLLIRKLVELEAIDPFFRKGDIWRRFSVAGFFTPDIIDDIRPILEPPSKGHLRDLVLRLLEDSPAVPLLSVELSRLALEKAENPSTRMLALRALLAVPELDHRANLTQLISEASETSLEMATAVITTLGPGNLDKGCLGQFWGVCSRVYPSDRQRQIANALGVRYYLRQFIKTLDLQTLESQLDDLTQNLDCHCGKNSYQCSCHYGLSKVVGMVLDRYFEVASSPPDSSRVWRWIRNLRFRNGISPDRSVSVKAIQRDDELRQAIISLAFEGVANGDRANEVHWELGWRFHSGLRFKPQDYRFIVDLAFSTGNTAIWSCFTPTHADSLTPEQCVLRRHMREQARLKPAFMAEWAIRNRVLEAAFRQQRVRRYGFERRRRRRKQLIEAANIRHLIEHKAEVEDGKHWGWLLVIANHYLMEPDRFPVAVRDVVDHEKALRNCLQFLKSYVPSLAEAQTGSPVILVLQAACLAIQRVAGNLDSVSVDLLEVVKTDFTSYQGVDPGEMEDLEAEINRRIFPNDEALESFLRRFVEPRLAIGSDMQVNSGWLGYKAEFAPLRAKLSIEWLRRFGDLNIHSLNALFETAAGNADRKLLAELIEQRCQEFITSWPKRAPTETVERVGRFWLLRSFYFMEEAETPYWERLKQDKATVLDMYRYTGRLWRDDHPNWPTLNARKIELVLDAFIEVWPKVQLRSGVSSEDSEGTRAYRFLTEIIWSIETDAPDRALQVLDRLLSDPRYQDMHIHFKSIRALKIRDKALWDFKPPTPQEITTLLDDGEIVTVEGLRKLVLEELEDYQRDIDGGEFNSVDRFYAKGDRLDEEACTRIIAERLSLKLQPLSITVTPEHHLKGNKRSDFTVAKTIGGGRRLLVNEVKGQWHTELFKAASNQLSALYAIHPHAEKQGIFVIIWFGSNEKVAGRKRHGVRDSKELKARVEACLPTELIGLIDVFVLDVSVASMSGGRSRYRG